jgi:hypothetical protein
MRRVVPLPEKLFVMPWMADKLQGVLCEGCLPVPPVEPDQSLAAMLEAGVLRHLGGLAHAACCLALWGARET